MKKKIEIFFKINIEKKSQCRKITKVRPCGCLQRDIAHNVIWGCLNFEKKSLKIFSQFRKKLVGKTDSYLTDSYFTV